MTKGRLYQAFVNAGFERKANVLSTRNTNTGNKTIPGLGYHIAIYDNMPLGTTKDEERTRARSAEITISQFIKIKANKSPDIIPCKPKESIITTFLNKYAPKSN